MICGQRKKASDYFFCADAHIILKIGGAYEIYFSQDAPKGLRGSEGCKIIDYKKNRFLVFTWNVPSTFEKARAEGYQSVVRIDFICLHPQETKIILTNTYSKKITNMNDIVSYFDLAWSSVLKSFQKACLSIKL